MATQDRIVTMGVPAGTELDTMPLARFLVRNQNVILDYIEANQEKYDAWLKKYKKAQRKKERLEKSLQVNP